jgi:uncharacterized protein YjiS (DUF1127 family)
MFEQLRHRFARWLKYRNTVHEFSLRDDHILRDVGIETPSAHAIRERARRALD